MMMPDTPFKPNRIAGRDWLALLLVLVAAAVVRFSDPTVVDYRQDQADLATLAQDMAQGKSIPLVGIPSSSRLPNSPATVYALVPAYLISSDPVFVSMYVALLNVIAAGLLWLLAFRYFNSTAALIAGLAYALNPWAVGFSRSIWAQDYVAIFVILSMLLGLYGFLEGKRIGQILSLPILLFGVQIHIAAYALTPLWLCLVWIGRKRLNKSALAITIALAVLVMVPFGLGMIQTLTNPVAPAEGVQALRREMSLRGLIKPYGQMAWLITGLGTEQYGAREVADQLMSSIFGPIPTIPWLLMLPTLLLGIWGLWRRFRRELAILVLLWAFLPLAVLTIPFLDAFPFYFIGSIPALMLLIGLGGYWLLDTFKSSQPLRYAIAAVFAFIFVTQGWWSIGTSRFVDKVYTPSQFGFATPIHYLFDVRDQLKSYQDVVFVGTGEWVDITASGSRVWAALLRDTVQCVRDVTFNRNFAVFPAGSFAAVFTPNVPENAIFDALYQQGAATDVTLREGEGVYRIYDLQTAPEQSNVEIMDVPPVEFSNGVKLTGYALADNLLTFQWSLPDATKTDYQYRVTFVDVNGETLDSVTTDFWAGLNWCKDDRLVSWLPLENLPEGATALRVEMLPRGGEPITIVIDPSASGEFTYAEIPLENR